MKLSKDLREFVALLNSRKIKYLLVGGYAVAYHGLPRYTEDIDFLIEISPENTALVAEVVREFGFKDFKTEDFGKPKTVIQLGRAPNRIPEMFKTNTIAWYGAPSDNTVLSTSLRLIQRYAQNGRIYRSSAIWGQFAAQPFETAACEDAAKGDKEALKYVKDCKAIIDREAEMCYWQFIEDMIEFKFTIPEIEEENQVDRLIQKLNGTWTNKSGMITFDPGGKFSTTQSNQHKFYMGTWMFRTKDYTMVVTSTNLESSEEEDLKIISVDDHNLVFSVGNRTNSVCR